MEKKHAYYQKEWKALTSQFSLTPQIVYEDLIALAPCFSGLVDRKKKVKEEVQEAISKFSKTLDMPNEIVPFLLSFSQENRLKKEIPLTLHRPGLLNALEERIFPLIRSYIDPLGIEAHLSEHMRVWIAERAKEKEIVVYDELINQVEGQLKNPAFLEKIRSRFQVVCIDEFQDTDRQQWSIFSTLFHQPAYSGVLYIVGDPKQSIYRFRQADLYTYLAAKKSFSEQALCSLRANFRSTPSLVQGLNRLFYGVEDLFFLPKTKESLQCPLIESGLKEEKGLEKDGKQAIHFMQGSTESALIDGTAQEILSLSQKNALPFSSFAVLVKDRFQGERIQQALKVKGIPTQARRSRLLTDSYAFRILYDLMEAMQDPSDMNAARKVLMGPLFRIDPQQVKEISPDLLKKLHYLRHLLETQGFFPFIYTLLQKEKCQIALLQGPFGKELLSDFLQLTDRCAEENYSVVGWCGFLDSLSEHANQDEALKAFRFSDEDAVQIYTIHLSKGLEFEVVFPLGLIASSPVKRELYLDDEKNCFTYEEEGQVLHAQELDAEKMRQLYVALTRAKKRLYIPILATEKEKKESSPSPMDLFLKKWLNGRTIQEKIQDSEECFSYSTASIGFTGPYQPPQPSVLLKAPTLELPSFPKRPLVSFSSLAVHQEEMQRSEIVQDIPAGALIGHLLHEMLEHLPLETAFKCKSPHELSSLIQPFLTKTPLEPWVETVGQWVYEAFWTPLPIKGSFPLGVVSPKKIFREMEFLFPKKSGL